MEKEVLEALKQFQKDGFGLPNNEHVDVILQEFKRVEAFLRALGGYDLALFRLALEENSFDMMKRMRAWNKHVGCTK